MVNGAGKSLQKWAARTKFVKAPKSSLYDLTAVVRRTITLAPEGGTRVIRTS